MIPVARPCINQDDIAAVMETLQAGELAQGSKIMEFEAAFANYIGVRFAIATSSGTTALIAAFRALELPAGSKVVTTPLTFAASVNSILWADAMPVFADINPHTFNLGVEQLLEALEQHPETRAVLIVHLYGLAAEMPEIKRICLERGIWLIEDCAQAVGAIVGNQKAGSFGHLATFSFYATKNMTTGEGGAVVTSSPELARRVRLYINHGQQESYNHIELGFNFRLSNLQAALGLSQLKRLDALNQRRRENAAYYLNNIRHEAVTLPFEPDGCQHTYHQFTVRSPFRDQLVDHLREMGVSTKIYYPTLVPDQPYFRSFPSASLPLREARRATFEVLSLPVFPSLLPEERAWVAKAVNSFRL